MSRPTFFRGLLLALALVPFQFASAQQDVPPAQPAGAHSPDWYYGATTPTTVETRPIAVQKAQLRAQQRMARLEALRRYGLTPNRPSAVAVPFTSVHTLSWMRNGRSPFIYYRSDRSRGYYANPNVMWR
jgi:hypothetical protein